MWNFKEILGIQLLRCSPICICKYKGNKTGVINDPLGQPTDRGGSACRLILKFWNGWTDNLCENSDTVRDWHGLVDQKRMGSEEKVKAKLSELLASFRRIFLPPQIELVIRERFFPSLSLIFSRFKRKSPQNKEKWKLLDSAAKSLFSLFFVFLEVFYTFFLSLYVILLPSSTVVVLFIFSVSAGGKCEV